MVLTVVSIIVNLEATLILVVVIAEEGRHIGLLWY